MRLWSDRCTWMKQLSARQLNETRHTATRAGIATGFHYRWRKSRVPEPTPTLISSSPPILSPSSPRPLLLRNGRQHSVSRIEVLTTHFLLSFDRQNEICAAAKKVGGRGRSTKAFAWESSWGQREKSRSEGVESKKSAIKAHNKDNDRRETQDLSRRLT